MRSALNAMKNLGFENPNVAILTANEMVDPKVISTVDAAALVEMVKNGELPACTAEGPIAFDVAFDKHAAEHKGIDSKIAGEVDLLIFPNIEAGNLWENPGCSLMVQNGQVSFWEQQHPLFWAVVPIHRKSRSIPLRWHVWQQRNNIACI